MLNSVVRRIPPYRVLNQNLFHLRNITTSDSLESKSKRPRKLSSSSSDSSPDIK